MATQAATGVLAGLRIIELSAFVAVPLGGMTLAQLGAEVVRIDPPGGGLDYGRWPLTAEGASLYWAGLNKGKRSVTVDMRTDRGREIVRGLVTASGDGAGILVTNLSPRWLDYEQLRAERPDVIMVVLRGSPDGSIAVDYTVNAAAGYPSVTGAADDVVNHVLPAWDVVAGTLVATAVLAAERHRTRTGEGALVELSLADVAFATVGHLGHVGEVVVNDDDRPRYGNYLYGSFGKDFVTADGHRVMVTALTPRQWAALVAATDSATAMAELEDELGVDLIDEGARFAARERIAEILAAWCAQRPLDAVGAAFDAHRVCWGPYRSFRGLVEEDPRVDPDRNPMWALVEQPGIGTYPAPGSPLSFSSLPRVPVTAAPRLGADTGDVLAEVLDLGEEDLAALRGAGTI